MKTDGKWIERKKEENVSHCAGDWIRIRSIKQIESSKYLIVGLKGHPGLLQHPFK